MIKGVEAFALSLILLFLAFGISYLISSEYKTYKEMKNREKIYRKIVFPFKKSGVSHTHNKKPAFTRLKEQNG